MDKFQAFVTANQNAIAIVIVVLLVAILIRVLAKKAARARHAGFFRKSEEVVAKEKENLAIKKEVVETLEEFFDDGTDTSTDVNKKFSKMMSKVKSRTAESIGNLKSFDRLIHSLYATSHATPATARTAADPLHGFTRMHHAEEFMVGKISNAMTNQLAVKQRAERAEDTVLHQKALIAAYKTRMEALPEAYKHALETDAAMLEGRYAEFIEQVKATAWKEGYIAAETARNTHLENLAEKSAKPATAGGGRRT